MIKEGVFDDARVKACYKKYGFEAVDAFADYAAENSGILLGRAIF